MKSKQRCRICSTNFINEIKKKVNQFSLFSKKLPPRDMFGIPRITLSESFYDHDWSSTYVNFLMNCCGWKLITLTVFLTFQTEHTNLKIYVNRI